MSRIGTPVPYVEGDTIAANGGATLFRWPRTVSAVLVENAVKYGSIFVIPGATSAEGATKTDANAIKLRYGDSLRVEWCMPSLVIVNDASVDARPIAGDDPEIEPKNLTVIGFRPA